MQERSGVPQSLDITTLLPLYKSGQLSPLDVINEVYDRIGRYHDEAVWTYVLPRQTALQHAESIINADGSRFEGPLFGIPFSVKDSMDVAPYKTTLACPSYAYEATETASVVQRVLDAGAIFIGKTNLDQFATGLTGHRSPYGTPRCVYDADYISGGSSSGSAVSVAANLVSFSIGTDTAGSTRVPAALNGLVGLKPTLGTISTEGLVPACKTADCVTVLARSIEDARLAWQEMKAFDEADVFARRELPRWSPWRPKLRYGIPPDDMLSRLSPAYASLFNRVRSLLPSLLPGEEVAFDYRPFESANNMLYGSSIVAQRLVAFDSYIKIHGLDKLHPVIQSIFESSSGFDAVQAYQDLFTLALYKRQAEAEFRFMDILVVPSTVTHFTVREIDEDPIGRNRLMGSFTHFVNLLDLCAVAVPAGKWVNGQGKALPFGVTLIGQAGKDEELMELGAKVMKACPVEGSLST
ncbi:MAG: hypothetical protein M1818_005501 [Claussenomyces sp. TS43310]|nr:MAG: hypothetical protein M1818_005501 [Claussenomyces sp. TS43310]